MRLSLAGDGWTCKPYVGEDWRVRRACHPETRDARGWYPAVVPGSPHADLWRAGAIPDPYHGLNSLLLEWIPERTWIYRRSFAFHRPRDAKRARLVFEGIDHEAEIYLNGDLIGSHAGMYTPAAFEVADRLREGPNHLAVAIFPAPREEPQIGRTSRVRTHKGRMTYGWDFCPRMPHLGIWDDVRLETSGAAHVGEIGVDVSLTDELDRAVVRVAAYVHTAGADALAVDARVTRLDERWQLEPRRLERYGDVSLAFADAPMAMPALWWPNGEGDQPLYEAHVRAVVDGVVSDERTVTFGIRRVRLAPNEGAPPSARAYTLEVNGRRIPMKGWNWVPLDVLYGVERPARLARLIELAKRAHVNLLRVWGGGLIEKESFYDACDRAGIMVWQEFIQSSSGLDNFPSQDQAFVDRMQREAERIVPRRRSHPSLVIWCGGNELADASGPLDEERSRVLAALREVVTALDPGRAWLPTSPSGPAFDNSLANIAKDPEGQHDVHGPWEHQGLEDHYTLYNKGTSLLHSEFGCEGMASVEQIERLIPAEHRWPATRDDPYWHHNGAWWINEPLLQQAFGGIGDLATLQRASQLMQAEGLRYAVEADRRRWPRCSGTIPWQYNEPYPNGYCTSAIEWSGRPKPAYYAVARAYAPVLLSASFDRMAWGGHDAFAAQLWVTTSRPVDGTLVARVVDARGREHARIEEHVALAARTSRAVSAIACALAPIEGVFFLDLALGDARARYPFSATADLAPFLALERTSLVLDRANGIGITVRGPVAAIGVRADAGPEAILSDDHLYLLPGERAEVLIEGTRSPVAVSAWNADARTLG